MACVKAVFLNILEQCQLRPLPLLKLFVNSMDSEREIVKKSSNKHCPIHFWRQVAQHQSNYRQLSKVLSGGTTYVRD